MSNECTEHNWQFATIATDPYNTLQQIELLNKVIAG